jgi:hypothetical protein
VGQEDSAHLADEEGVAARGELDGLDERAARGHERGVHAIGEVEVGSDEARALPHEMHGVFDALVGVVARLADHHKVRIHFVHREARFVQRGDQARLADDVARARGHLRLQKLRRRQRRRVKVVGLYAADAEAIQLLLELARRALAAVGEKQELLVVAVHPIHEILRAAQQRAAVIHDAIHVDNVPALLAKLHDGQPPRRESRGGRRRRGHRTVRAMRHAGKAAARRCARTHAQGRRHVGGPLCRKWPGY